jgi:hypothetical protein
LDAEEGNAVSMRVKGACTPRGKVHAFFSSRGRVLHSVQRPVHVDRHYTPPAQAVGGGALGGVSRSGKPAQAGGTGTGVPSSGRRAARRVLTASARKAAWHVEKRKEVAASVPARIRELGLVPARRKRSCRSRQATLVPNKLTHQASQKRTGESERGPSAERPSAVKRRRPHRAKKRRGSGWSVEKRSRTGEGLG